MAAEYGFVYVLRNECMPGIYKIGMTTRPPSQRCDELSAATAVPLPFEIVCFGDVCNPTWVESAMHEAFSERRVNDAREFFALTGDDMAKLFALLLEQSNIVGFGDLSFLSGGRGRPLIKRAAKSVETTDTGMFPSTPDHDLAQNIAQRFWDEPQ